MNTRPMQCLDGVDVPHTDHDPAIHEKTLDRRTPTHRQRFQDLTVEGTRQWLEPQMGKMGVGLQTACGPYQDQTESSRIAKPEASPRVQEDRDVFVGLRQRR